MFSYSPIDRHVLVRDDSSQVSEYLQSPESRILLWHKGKLVAPENKSHYFLFEELQGLTDQLSDPVYLGRHDKHSYFAFQLNQWHSQFDGLDLLALRSASLFVTDYHLGLLFYSQAVLNWHYYHQFCARCGSNTYITHSGHGRKCSNPDCGREHYPRIDPAVIFSVINNSGPESKILLGRKSCWDENRYSVIAGFVEPGETLEDSVKREAYEETSLKVENISYVASQPWPFPGQIMLGFSCETSQWDIRLIDKELETASWFSADEIESKIKTGEFKMPFSASISWYLINRWFIQQKAYSLKKN